MSKSKNSKLSALDAERILMLVEEYAVQKAANEILHERMGYVSLDEANKEEAAKKALQDFLEALSKD